MTYVNIANTHQINVEFGLKWIVQVHNIGALGHSQRISLCLHWNRNTAIHAIYPSCTELFCDNIKKIHLYFLSCLNFEMAQMPCFSLYNY